MEFDSNHLIKRSHSGLAKEFLDKYEYLIDAYATLPSFIFYYIENKNQLYSKNINVETTKFSDLNECASYIKSISYNNYFIIFSISYEATTINPAVVLRSVNISLDYDIPKLKSVKIRKNRDRKISEILK